VGDSIVVTAHYSGSQLTIPKSQAEFFKNAPSPKTKPGSAVCEHTLDDEENFEEMYDKYPNIVRGSIYRVKSNVKAPSEKIVKIEGKIRIKTGKIASGATRCIVTCQSKGCKNQRDIKVQDAFQVKYCEECKRRIRKENLKEFLKKKKESKK
jgi:hypothetical protein